MSLYRNSVFDHVPVTFSQASHIRRTSVHSQRTPSVFSGQDEEQGRGEPRFEVQLDDARAKRIEEEGNGSTSLPGQAGDAVHGPFDCVSNPAPWWHQITIRALVCGGVIGAVLSIIIHKLSLTTGIIPSFNIAAGLLGFVALRAWTGVLNKLKITPHPFTPQENTVVQTCVVACSSLAFAGGFGCYLLSMDRQTFLNLGSIGGNRPQDVYEPDLKRIIPYMFCIGLIGIFTLVILRKRFIIDYRLQFPSGTATGVLISSFHTPKGEAAAQAQVKTLGYWGGTSFLFSFFKWFFSANSDNVSCGFNSWPSLGLNALAYNWNFDFSLTYIGVGMIVPYVVAYSLMFGAILSWGVMWPLLTRQAGNWYPAGLQDGDFRGLFGYKNFIAIAVFVADGLYNFLKIGILSLQVFLDQLNEDKLERRRTLGRQVVGTGCKTTTQLGTGQLPGAPPANLANAANHDAAPQPEEAFERNSQGQRICSLAEVCEYEREVERLQKLRDAVFLRGCIPWWNAAAGYAAFAVLAIVVIPLLYHPVKWYMVLVLVFVAPVFAVANAYGAGLTDFDMSSIYGTVVIFAFAAWAGTANGGVIAGLGVSGFVMASTSSAATLMQDFKTGHITMSSPWSMFMSQIVGALMGCFIAPLTFQMYWRSFPIGVPTSEYKAPYANIYRGMAILGTQGIGELPQHCAQLMLGFFLVAILMSIVRDVLPPKWARLVPIPMAMAIPFYIGANVAIDICIGALVKAYWHWTSPATAEGKVPAAASGLIAGDGLWSIPSAILAICKVQPPICMSFARAGTV